MRDLVETPDVIRGRWHTWIHPEAGSPIRQRVAGRLDFNNQLTLDRYFIEYAQEQEEFPMTGRWIFRDEFQLLLRLAGFERWHAFGTSDGGALENAGDRVIVRFALTVYVIATAVLLGAEGAFMFDRRWIGPEVVLYVVLAFLAEAAFGVALLRTGLVPAWAAWATIVWNLGWLALCAIVRPDDIYYPVLHHVAPALIGVALLLSA